MKLPNYSTTDSEKFEMFGEIKIELPFFKPQEKEMKITGFLKGIPSSSGIVIAKALVIQTETFVSPDEKVEPVEIPHQKERFLQALNDLRIEFNDVLAKIPESNKSASTILETNLYIINDSFLIDSVISIIENGFSAESSVIREFERQKSYFLNSKDRILRERAIELDHVKLHILGVLKQRRLQYNVAKEAVIVTQSLTPTDFVNYHEAGALAIVTEAGGIASHVSILARSFETPAVIGVKDASSIIKSGDLVIVDGFTGLVIYNPTKDFLIKYDEKIQKIEKHRQELGILSKESAVTIDGRRIHLMANVDRLDDIDAANFVGADGIGLVRSESLIINYSSIPGEDIQAKWYREIADRIYPNPVTIRAFDIGSDKYSESIIHTEANPALGFRGIRYLLSRTEIFKTQIRAVLQASVNKNIRFMLPMITDYSELVKSLQIIDECKKELRDELVEFDEKMPVGIMIETPSAALMAYELANIADFFSIGTNDLTQYTLAVDRTNEHVSDRFDSFNPAVLKLIAMTAEAAARKKIPIGVCGELAGHSAATAVLIGMGITELSVVPGMILELKSRIRQIKYSSLKRSISSLLKLPNSTEILKILES